MARSPGAGVTAGRKPSILKAEHPLTDTPDQVINVHPGACSACGKDLQTLTPRRTKRRRITELPPIQPVVLETGQHEVDCDNDCPAVNCGPNSFDEPAAERQFLEPPLRLTGCGARYDHRLGNDDCVQAGNLFQLFNAGLRSRLVGNLVAAMNGVPTRIQLWHLTRFYQADPENGCAVADGLGIHLIANESLAQLPLPELLKAATR